MHIRLRLVYVRKEFNWIWCSLFSWTLYGLDYLLRYTFGCFLRALLRENVCENKVNNQTFPLLIMTQKHIQQILRYQDY